MLKLQQKFIQWKQPCCGLKDSSFIQSCPPYLNNYCQEVGQSQLLLVEMFQKYMILTYLVTFSLAPAVFCFQCCKCTMYSIRPTFSRVLQRWALQPGVLYFWFYCVKSVRVWLGVWAVCLSVWFTQAKTYSHFVLQHKTQTLIPNCLSFYFFTKAAANKWLNEMTGVVANIKAALCSFGEYILFRRRRSALTIF